MDEGERITAETALAISRTVKTGEPFVFEAREGDFLVFRTGDNSIGVISVADVEKLARENHRED